MKQSENDRKRIKNRRILSTAIFLRQVNRILEDYKMRHYTSEEGS